MLEEKKASKEDVGSEREIGGREATSHRASQQLAVFPSVMESH